MNVHRLTSIGDETFCAEHYALRAAGVEVAPLDYDTDEAAA